MSNAASVRQRYFGGLLVLTQLMNPAIEKLCMYVTLLYLHENNPIGDHYSLGRRPPAPVPERLVGNCCCAVLAACTLFLAVHLMLGSFRKDPS